MTIGLPLGSKSKRKEHIPSEVQEIFHDALMTIFPDTTLELAALNVMEVQEGSVQAIYVQVVIFILSWRNWS